MRIISILIFMITSTFSNAQHWISKQQLLIGDTLTHTIKLPIENAANAGIMSVASFKDFNIYGTIKIDTLNQNDKIYIQQIIILQPLYYGSYTINDSGISKDSIVRKTLTPNQFFVDTPMIDFSKDIRTIVQPKEPQNYGNIIAIGIGVLLLLAALLFLLNFWHKKSKVENTFKKTKALLVKAKLEKDATQAAALIQEALKYYLEKRLMIPSITGTNTQVKFFVQMHAITIPNAKEIADLLVETDAAKFAKFQLQNTAFKIELAEKILQDLEQRKIAEEIRIAQEKKQRK
jgi:hypothetical protein